VLGFTIVEDAKNLNCADQVLQAYPVSTLLVLEGQLVNLSKRKLLLLNELANVAADCVLSIRNVCVESFKRVHLLLVDVLYKTAY
jgi:hypothetical protein